MNKKVRIEIPKNGLSKAEIEQLADRELSIRWIVMNQGKEFSPGEVTNLPAFLLEEVECPQKPGEIVRRILNLEIDDCGRARTYHCDWRNLIDLIKAGEENELIRHKPKQTFKEWWNGLHSEYQDRVNEEDAFGIWSAIEKNRGYDE